MIRTKRTFHARWSAKRQWWNLYCRKCGTTEELTRGKSFPEEIAVRHDLWWHHTQPRIPIGWSKPR